MKLQSWDKLERLLRPLSEQEHTRLERSLKQQGQQLPITVLPDGRIIDGLNRWRILGNSVKYGVVDLPDEQAYALGILLNTARRQMTSEQIVELHKQLGKASKEEKKAIIAGLRKQGMSQKEAAARVGVSQQTVDLWENTNNTNNGKTCIPDYRVKVPKKKYADIILRASNGETQIQIAADIGITQQRVAQIIKKQTEKAEKKSEQEEKAHAAGYVKPDYRVGDFREVLADIPDNSVDLILTDPPYGEEAVTLYQDLGILAKRILKPEGSLFAYSGQATLSEVLSVLSQSLRYWWTLCMMHSGTGQKLPGKWVFVDWKPIVWFVKEKRRDQTYIKDLLEGEIPDKTELAWAQGTGEVRYLIEQLTNVEDLIIDPFAGTGQWGEIAGQMGRRWIGSDLQAGGGLNT